MKNLPVSVRRILGLTVAVLAGTFATLAIASPASAHHTWVEGSAVCDAPTGTWKVTWTVFNSQSNLDATLTKVVWTPTGSPGTGIAVDAIVPKKPVGKLVGVQTVPGSATQASLAVRGSWPNGVTDGQDRSETVTFGGACQQNQPKPTATFTSDCDGTVVVQLGNKAGTAPVSFVVTGINEPVSVPAGGEKSVTVPAGSAANITVKVGTTEVATYSWKDPGTCAPVKVASKSDCTTVTISLENPAGNRPIDATVKSGAETKQVTIAGGETKEVTFPAGAGTTATVTYGSGAAAAANVAPGAAAAAVEPVTVTWADPGNCAPPPPPDLPDTGVQVAGLVSAGAALVALGAGVLFFLYRRRNAPRPTTL